jgi:GGDEF domain-containing protein
MKAKTVRNLSAALVSIFIIALFILVGGLLYYYRQGLNNAESILSALIEREMDFSALDANAVLPDQLTKKMDTALNLNENLAAVSITINNNLVYAEPFPSQFFDENKTLTVPSVLLKIFSADFTAGNGATGVASAAIYVLNPEEIFKSARIAFLMILAATLAAVILIVYTKFYLDKSPAPPVEEPDTEDSGAEQDEITGETVSFPVEPAQIPEEPVQPPANTLFYSGETGFMREAYIEQVLDPILINAASHNDDIAFLLILIPGLDRASLIGVEVCKSILEQFISKERIFEYGSDSFAAILQNSDAEKAVAEASQLYRTLNEKMAALEPLPEVRIGIASKAFRTTVAASVMFDEAKQAIARAGINPDTPIVALKINPEKYREFVKDE